MSNKTIRIRTTPLGKDKYVKLNINQEFDFIEVLSLKITQEEAYRNFCSDYGVVAGRVVINSGFGVPNARVSIFIPLDEVDKNNPQIKGLYPFEVISDKDSEGIRYNLLPRASESQNDCFTPVGTFPSKREILDDEDMMYVYEKYYKFTTTTNDAGDFMIFGVPLGNYKIHVDLDISDMGIASQRPYDSIEQGSSLSLFESPTKFKSGTNLDKLAQIKTANSSVNVQPFWGDIDECQIGISRVDIDMNYTVTPSAIFMGGIFGDQDKYNVKSNCVGDKNVGDLCHQIASEGTIEMIRKTVFGDIERYDVQGGRVINENGAWAYQVPMNLDYVVTDEYGSLIPSQDPNKGIPTRASVRFRIAMDNSMGGLGRHRTRAKYLVPHNPKNENEIDYEFGTLTKDSSFKDLYWNKIYSVKNFISRYQRIKGLDKPASVKNRQIIALKNADGCVGDKNPIPFNRVSTRPNALFFIICLVMYLVASIMFVLNMFVISFINFFIFIWNTVLKIFIPIGFDIDVSVLSFSWYPFDFLKNFLIPPIPCLKVDCPNEEESSKYAFAPGCYDNWPLVDIGRKALVDSGISNEFIFSEIPQLTKCVAVEMAKDMDMFKYDFYNDWLNGSLFSFLVRFKKYRNYETFCDFDCDKTNSCYTSVNLDSCFAGDQSRMYVPIKEGVVKKNGDEYYYAASTKDGRHKLYATDIINLGAVNNCDWQGLPKIQEFLKTSTFNNYPTVDQIDPDTGALVTSGQVNITIGNGMFFEISCQGLSSNYRECLNIKHSNEIGVDIDQLELNPITLTPINPDHLIGKPDINQIYGVYVRDMLYRLNYDPTNLFLPVPPTGIDTNFNIINTDSYDPTKFPDNGQQYVDYRGMVSYNSFQQPKNSYFFYFGILPGKSGLELMNNKFFTTCFPKIKTEFLIKILSYTGVSVSCQGGIVTNGAVTFSILAGDGPFRVTTSGPNSNTNNQTVSGTTPTINLTNLQAGNYTITVVDSNNSVVTQTFEIPNPSPMFATAYSVDITGTTSNGQVVVDSIQGGCGPYQVSLYNHNGGLVSGPIQVTNLPHTFSNLPLDTSSNGLTGFSEHFGYYVVITDSSNPSQTYTIYDLTVDGPTPITISATSKNVTCFGGINGAIQISASGGTLPYAISGIRTTPPASNPPQIGEQFSSQAYSGATAGIWSITVKDQGTPQQIFTTTISLSHLNPELKMQIVGNARKQCDNTSYNFRFKITGTGKDGVPGNTPASSAGHTYIDLVNGATPLQGPLYNNKVYYTWAIDSGIKDLSDSTNGWSDVQTATLLPNDEFDVSIPLSVIPSFGKLAIALTNPLKTCISNVQQDGTQYLISQLKLAPQVQALNINTKKQCSRYKVNIRFDINHLLGVPLQVDYRGPYTLYYKIKNLNGSYYPSGNDYLIYGTTSGFPPVTTPIPINQNQQSIDILIPTTPVSVLSPTNKYMLKFYIVDSVGCESDIKETEWITVPQDPLNIKKNPLGGGFINFEATGGIQPYKTTNGPLVVNDVTPFGGPVPCGSPVEAVSITVVDNNGIGCEVTRNFLTDC